MEVFYPGMGHMRDPPLQHMFIPASVETPFIYDDEGAEDAVDFSSGAEGKGDKRTHVNIALVLTKWLVPSANVKRLLRNYKDYLGSTCVVGERGLNKLFKQKDSILGDIYVFGTDGKHKVDWLGKEMKVVGGACAVGRRCAQRRIADIYGILLCEKVVDDSTDGDDTVQRMWEAYSPWRTKGRYHFEIK
uniref:Uncharacterized protein n=2 Tax=Rhodosorus marinus TaxID=101924 RepID=A0A7S3A665_9RHOD|mmetsp:Transcript_4913/g.21126  ORF Transcript_4913/g.21126 Transcript_4913/m.21126 type:complete len:189 (+) Transcript_4913:448-1014(+)